MSEQTLNGKHAKSLAKPVYIDNLDPKDYVIIDVRGKDEYDDVHIKGAINLDEMDDIESKVKSTKDKKVLIQCRRGGRAAKVGTHLVEKGYDVYYFDDLFSKFYDRDNITLEGKNIDSLRNLSY
ncbi:hypothetical protein BKH43_04115 [Helicobacter sp. 13S00401-1]|uniref:rhodanese-like domain-containing protein n=1 Tax=Helicobacter sp. 13S00401-1 TaxID=1905758 RepID=UPI000BA4F6D4|nr:rhodanese-like domain-containing protein [Helicobacter sp. 13S00401-1]PAF50749.1 hypothetical protein BKH43_04115 [Helicobacter sp. 13S00401-1]